MVKRVVNVLIIQRGSQEMSIPVINGIRNEGLIVLFKVAEVTREGIKNMILRGQ